MEDDLVLLGSNNDTPFLNTSSMQRFLLQGSSRFAPITGFNISEEEKKLLSGKDFKRGNKRISGSLNLRGVSQEDYTKLSNLDLFRGGSLSDVTNTSIKDTSFRQNSSGTVARTKGDALSLLNETDLETLSKVVSARQGQILGNTLSPGLSNQGFSLLSGNFGR